MKRKYKLRRSKWLNIYIMDADVTTTDDWNDSVVNGTNTHGDVMEESNRVTTAAPARAK